MRSWLFSQDFALSLQNGNFRERGSKGTSPPRGLAMSYSQPSRSNLSQAVVSPESHSPVGSPLSYCPTFVTICKILLPISLY